MMNFNYIDFAGFLGARARRNMTALDALAELEARKITHHAGCVSMRTATAVCDSLCQKNGLKTNTLSAHDLATLLRRS